IGTQKEWQQRLANYGVELQGHYLACPLHKAFKTRTIKIERHKAAMVRKSLSRPVRLALEADLFSPDTTFFDYGCGWGGDVERMAKKGYQSSGWDPYYRPETAPTSSAVVNLGYIINVIEDLAERREALVRAWELTQQVLIVAAQVLISSSSRGQIAYGDGVITNRSTFQKYYEQEELKSYIDQVLNADAIPVGLGIYFVFRNETQAQTFRASRFRSRAITPKVRKPIRSFEDYQELLNPLMAFFTERGRLPVKGELAQEVALKEEFGTLRRAFKVILQVTEPQEWEAIAAKRRQDLQLYLALAELNRRPKLREFAPTVKEDFKGLFGSYRQATFEAEDMLFSLGDPEVIAECCLHSKIGQKQRNSLLVHISSLENLNPLLRLYEGCASRTIGRMEEVTLIKFHSRKPKISYLFYPDFDTEPHPLLHTSMQIDLRDLHVSYWEYEPDNPPILHQKETLVTTDYPLYEKFARLSRQEQDWGLLDDLSSISHLQGWLRCLEDHCATIKGHRLIRRKDTDPYKVKVLKAAVQARKRGSGDNDFS
ncbi:MAG: DNA phosphorothioation-associated putative methyltransferase, partial [Spirulinaceae cyanobacterium]